MIESGKLNLEKLVHSLLWQNDCVILPELGALITRENQAALNPATHIIKPRSRSIFFNPGISKTDGLLANYLTENFGLGYADAVQMIDDAIGDIKKEISAGKKVKWDSVGEFFGASDKTFFIPKTELNFLPETFGLFPIQLKPISEKVVEPATTIAVQKEEIKENVEPIEKEVSEIDYNKTELQPEFNQPAAIEEKKTLMRYLRWPIAAAIVAALVIVGVSNENKTYNFQEKAAVLDLDLQANGEVVTNKTESKELNFEIVPEESIENTDIEEKLADNSELQDNNVEATELVVEESTTNVQEEAETIVEPVQEESSEVSIEPTLNYNLNDRYHIVVAKTIVKEKAEAMLSNTQLYYLPIGNSFVHRIGIASSNNQESLRDQLPGIRTEFPRARLIDKIAYEKL